MLTDESALQMNMKPIVQHTAEQLKKHYLMPTKRHLNQFVWNDKL